MRPLLGETLQDREKRWPWRLRFKITHRRMTGRKRRETPRKIVAKKGAPRREPPFIAESGKYGGLQRCGGLSLSLSFSFCSFLAGLLFCGGGGACRACSASCFRCNCCCCWSCFCSTCWSCCC